MFRTVHYEIRSPKVPEPFDGFSMVHLSDLHGAVYGEKNRLLIEKIRELQPDLVVMTGDMADAGDGSALGLIDLCRRLLETYPVYYVPGNHEQAMKPEEQEWLMGTLKDLGVLMLANQRRSIWRREACVEVYGLVMAMTYYKDPMREDYVKGIHFSTEDTRQALGEAKESRFNILLCHNPLYFPSYRDWGADLTLSGHIHGGIIRIPGLGGLLSPDLTLFPKYDGGCFHESGRHLVVSRGLGNHFLVRVMNPAELVLVTLRTKGDKRDV